MTPETMAFDLQFTAGFVVFVLALPAMIGALFDGRPPRAAAIGFVVGGGLMLFALMRGPAVHGFEDVLDIFLRVIAAYNGLT